MIQIRLRAERKVGQLLREQAEKGERRTRATASPGRGGKKNQIESGDLIPTLSDLGVTPTQSSKFQQLAAIPEEDFEEAISDPDELPSTQSVIDKATKQKPKVKRG